MDKNDFWNDEDVQDVESEAFDNNTDSNTDNDVNANLKESEEPADEEDDDDDEFEDDFESASSVKAKDGKGYGKLIALIIVAVLFVLAIIAYFRYLTPYVSEAQIEGVVEPVEKSGYIFKTYDGSLILSSSSLTEGDSLTNDNKFMFSVSSDSVAHKLMDMQGKCIVVRYEKYLGIVPWRGRNAVVIKEVVRVKE